MQAAAEAHGSDWRCGQRRDGTLRRSVFLRQKYPFRGGQKLGTAACPMVAGGKWRNGRCASTNDGDFKTAAADSFVIFVGAPRGLVLKLLKRCNVIRLVLWFADGWEHELKDQRDDGSFGLRRTGARGGAFASRSSSRLT